MSRRRSTRSIPRTGLVMSRLEYLVTARCTESRTAGRDCGRMAASPSPARPAMRVGAPCHRRQGAQGRGAVQSEHLARVAPAWPQPSFAWGRDRDVPGTGRRRPSPALRRGPSQIIAQHRVVRRVRPVAARRRRACGRCFRAAVHFISLGSLPLRACTVGAGDFAACLRPAW